MCYTRWIQLFGTNNQQKLLKSKVLVVGAGGLGCPLLQLLLSVGMDTLGLVDPDKVEAHNLHRQLFFDKTCIGMLKIDTAVTCLRARNLQAVLRAYLHALTTDNVFSIIADYDVVVDGANNFSMYYPFSDACAIARKPLVCGALCHYEGQASVFNVEKDGCTTSYRDLFPVAPWSNEVPTCSGASILPIISSMIAYFQTSEMMKLPVSNLNNALIHTLLLLNTQNYQLTRIKYNMTDRKAPSTVEEVQQFSYPAFCHQPVGDKLTAAEALDASLAQEKAVLVDARREDEQSKIDRYTVLSLPFSVLFTQWEQLRAYDHVYFVCIASVRNMETLNFTKEVLAGKDLKSFKQGSSSLVNV